MKRDEEGRTAEISQPVKIIRRCERFGPFRLEEEEPSWKLSTSISNYPSLFIRLEFASMSNPKPPNKLLTRIECRPLPFLPRLFYPTKFSPFGWLISVAFSSSSKKQIWESRLTNFCDIDLFDLLVQSLKDFRTLPPLLVSSVVRLNRSVWKWITFVDFFECLEGFIQVHTSIGKEYYTNG